MKKNRYLVAPYKISIFEDSYGKQHYNAIPIFKSDKYNLLIYNIENKLLEEKGLLDSEILKLDKIIKILKFYIKRILKEMNLDLKFKKSYLIDWLVHRILKLDFLMPLLIDDKVQEIYLDKPGTNLYIDHQDFGRCITSIILDKENLEFFKTRLCLEKNLVLNTLNPSIKTEIETEQFHIRASVDIAPLASDGISMNIRKLRKKIWTLPELIFSNMLSLEAAVYLLFILNRRKNITIIGEPGTGKTTLANSIDIMTPNSWRKISIEDVIESVEQSCLNKFQTRYSVSPFENNKNESSKSQEIIKLLHRSPNWVFLGEIQTAEHSRALFEALSAGLVGIQTCHGRSIELMFIRWLNQHKIPTSSILALDIIIETKSELSNWKIKRYVSRISEIQREKGFSSLLNNKSEIELIDIFKFNSKENSLEKKVELFDSPLIKEICKKENLSEEKFKINFLKTKKILLDLIDKRIFNPQEIVSKFNNKFLKHEENKSNILN